MAEFPFFQRDFNSVIINFHTDSFTEEEVDEGNCEFTLVVKENGFTFAAKPVKKLKGMPKGVSAKMSLEETMAKLGELLK